jgi:hypothetical protein
MADGSVSTSLAKTIDITLSALQPEQSGAIVYTHGANITFPNNLPDGFNCVILNASNSDGNASWTDSLFYTKSDPLGTNWIDIPAGGTIKVNVISISGSKRYHISGDL